MSLILEALRKSEAERRRGQAPGVAVELPPPVPARDAAFTRWWWLPAALLLLAMLAWWRWPRTDDAQADRVATAMSTPVDPLPPEPAATDPTMTTAAGEAADSPPETPALVAREPGPVAPPPPPTAPAEPPAVPRPEPVAATPMPPASPSRAGERSDLNADIAELPPLKLSMHMWDDSPARRFVILNGQRMAEGDRNGGIEIIAIERGGVIVESEGRRARLPLP